jgi:hypothetical protein
MNPEARSRAAEGLTHRSILKQEKNCSDNFDELSLRRIERDLGSTVSAFASNTDDAFGRIASTSEARDHFRLVPYYRTVKIP